MNALKSAESDHDFLSLPSSRLSVSFRETTKSQLFHEIEKVVGKQKLVFVKYELSALSFSS